MWREPLPLPSPLRLGTLQLARPLLPQFRLLPLRLLLALGLPQ